MKTDDNLYAGIDLHSDNSYLTVINDQDKRFIDSKLPNDINIILRTLAPFKDRLIGIVVESTYNWYWLIDALEENGYQVHLGNPAANIQYSGLKHTDDSYDSFWLAHLLRLGILKEGYIYPKDLRAVRDLMRKRCQMVQNRTSQILSIQSAFSKFTGGKIKTAEIKKLDAGMIREQFPNVNQAMSLYTHLVVMRTLEIQISELERLIINQVKLAPEYEKLKTVDGIGKILALTIMLETGDIERFQKVGNYASYCRCVSSKKSSNDKKKGTGNVKNGNKYLSWAFIEAANFFIRFNDQGKRYYQKKAAKTKKVIAIKAIAHKLSRACYFIMRDQCDFDVNRLFRY